jgi:hypothetical protein
MRFHGRKYPTYITTVLSEQDFRDDLKDNLEFIHIQPPTFHDWEVADLVSAVKVGNRFVLFWKRDIMQPLERIEKSFETCSYMNQGTLAMALDVPPSRVRDFCRRHKIRRSKNRRYRIGKRHALLATQELT